MTPRRFAVWGAVLVAGLLWGVARAEEGRSLPLSKQSVFNYFRQVEEERRSIDADELKPDEYLKRTCQAYVMVLRKTGFDFETTVRNAVQFAEKGDRKLDDPRFLFLAAVFQFHPDIFLKLGLLSQTTRDAVLTYFGQDPSRSTATTRPVK